jgi:hypothetical protein
MILREPNHKWHHSFYITRETYRHEGYVDTIPSERMNQRNKGFRQMGDFSRLLSKKYNLSLEEYGLY